MCFITLSFAPFVLLSAPVVDVDPSLQALQRFRAAGLSHAKIETLQQNAVGRRLYADSGFQEVARQVHFVAALDKPAAAS